MFTDAGDSGADNLAVWDGATWEPFCTEATQTIGNVRALQIVGPTLYVGGDFQDGAGIAPPTTCSRATWPPAFRGTPSSTTPTRSPAR